jgi:hypothetical protein
MFSLHVSAAVARREDNSLRTSIEDKMRLVRLGTKPPQKVYLTSYALGSLQVSQLELRSRVRKVSSRETLMIAAGAAAANYCTVHQGIIPSAFKIPASIAKVTETIDSRTTIS